ncbi:AMP-binding protein [Actinocatenispora rupis]|uniref:AMP-binding protein n=1 Tax=Actinocatenispora rupis TaxID=519421 RepID=UPI001EF16E13|nr:AMP-binding protein [Actinocatenispora rupis]
MAVEQDIRNILDLLSQAARDRPDHVALRCGTATVRWSELSDAVRATANGLRELRPGPGDRLALVSPNGIDWVVAYFAALAADLVVVPGNPAYTGAELGRLLADSGARVLVGTPEVHEATADHTVTRYVVGGAHPAARPFAELRADGDLTAPVRGGEDTAVLLYTSGTSGTPRAAMLSHRALLANGEQLAALDPPPVGPDDVVLLALPLFHAFGLGPGLHAVVRHAATGVLVTRFDAETTLDDLSRYEVSTVLGVPSMYAAWVRRPGFAERFARVRLAVTGAAPLAPETRQALADAGVEPWDGYGLTEAGPVVTSSLVAPARRTTGSVGRPLAGVELRLVGADGEPISAEEYEEDADASPGTDPGEIHVRGANLFSGYWPDGVDGPDADGWWATGDVGYVDEDGDLFLVDRIGELILVSGFNVYPREVELVLVDHPAVREAAVVGAPHPLTGQAVRAFVVLYDGAHVGEDDLIDYCHRYLAHFKCPVGVDFVAELPHSATGKVRKSVLRDTGGRD